jgi:hypothetical protein
MKRGNEQAQRWQLSVQDLGAFVALIATSLAVGIASTQVLEPYSGGRVLPAVALLLSSVFTFGGGFGFLADRLQGRSYPLCV